jgi:hypothetical protein
MGQKLICLLKLNRHVSVHDLTYTIGSTFDDERTLRRLGGTRGVKLLADVGEGNTMQQKSDVTTNKTS